MLPLALNAHGDEMHSLAPKKASKGRRFNTVNDRNDGADGDGNGCGQLLQSDSVGHRSISLRCPEISRLANRYLTAP